MNGLLSGFGTPQLPSPSPTVPASSSDAEKKVVAAAESYILGSMVLGIITAAAVGGAAIWTVAGVRYFLKRRR